MAFLLGYAFAPGQFSFLDVDAYLGTIGLALRVQ